VHSAIKSLIICQHPTIFLFLLGKLDAAQNSSTTNWAEMVQEACLGTKSIPFPFEIKSTLCSTTLCTFHNATRSIMGFHRRCEDGVRPLMWNEYFILNRIRSGLRDNGKRAEY